MPSLVRFLTIVGLIFALFYGGMYVLATYFEPQPKEISKTIRNVRIK